MKAKDLEFEGRPLARRALLLHRYGWRVAREARRRAVIEILHRVRPAARKMRQVRREQHALARRASLEHRPPAEPRSFSIGLPKEDWIKAVELADPDLFEQRYSEAARYSEWLPAIAAEAGVIKETDVPFDERASLLTVNLLLLDNPIREKVGLPIRPLRRGLDIRD